MDTKFSVALHILTMISESRETLSSQTCNEWIHLAISEKSLLC